MNNPLYHVVAVASFLFCLASSAPSSLICLADDQPTVGVQSTVESVIKRLDWEVFSESSPNLTADETLERLQQLGGLLGQANNYARSEIKEEVNQLLEARAVIDSKCSSYNVGLLHGYIDKFRHRQVNVVPYLKSLLVMQLARCAAKLRESASGKLAAPRRQQIKTFYRKVTEAIRFNDDGEEVLTMKELRQQQRGPIVFSDSMAKAVLSFMKDQGAFFSSDDKSEEYFYAEFNSFVGDMCQATRTAIETPATVIRDCPIPELLVLIDQQTLDWIETLDICSSVLNDHFALYESFKSLNGKF